MVMINLMAAASKHNVETGVAHPQKLCQKKKTTNSCTVCRVQMAQV